MHEHLHVLAGYLCPEGDVPQGVQPQSWHHHFDTVHSWLTIFQCITLEG